MALVEPLESTLTASVRPRPARASSPADRSSGPAGPGTPSGRDGVGGGRTERSRTARRSETRPSGPEIPPVGAPTRRRPHRLGGGHGVWTHVDLSLFPHPRARASRFGRIDSFSGGRMRVGAELITSQTVKGDTPHTVLVVTPRHWRRSFGGKNCRGAGSSRVIKSRHTFECHNELSSSVGDQSGVTEP
jgi:hypothetical protein